MSRFTLDESKTLDGLVGLVETAHHAVYTNAGQRCPLFKSQMTEACALLEAAAIMARKLSYLPER